MTNHTNGPGCHREDSPALSFSCRCASRNVRIEKALCMRIECQSSPEIADFASRTKKGNNSGTPFGSTGEGSRSSRTWAGLPSTSPGNRGLDGPSRRILMFLVCRRPYIASGLSLLGSCSWISGACRTNSSDRRLNNWFAVMTSDLASYQDVGLCVLATRHPTYRSDEPSLSRH